MKKSIMLTLITVFSIGFVLGDIPSVYAQEEFTLEEITVTAQKREENQQKVPIAMEVVSGDMMRELGYNNLEEIMASISPAFINKAQDGMRVSIRGMSDDIRSIGTMSVSTPTVAVNVDGVYTSRRNSGSGLYDMERVEVLYGPQSTLYSTSAPGGIVNIVTANPKTDKYEVFGSLEYGKYNTVQLEGMMNTPISDRFALRAAFTASMHDGYLANGSDDEDTKSIRVKALFKPNDRLSFVGTGEYTRRGGVGYSGVQMFVSPSDLVDPWDNSSQDPAEPRNHDQRKLLGHFDWDLGFGGLALVTSYVTESSFVTMQRENFFTGETYSQSSDRNGTEKGVELRLASSEDSRIKWIIGGNYYRSIVDQMDMPDNGYYEFRIVEQTTDAFFGNITYPVSDRFRLTAGARKTSDDFYLSEEMFKEGATLPGSPPDFVVFLITLTSYDNPDYKLGVEYDLGPDLMLYADWSSSYRSVGMPIRQLDPEVLSAYTLGMKSRFMGNKLQLNAATFYYDYKDYVADFGRVSDPDLAGRSDEGSLANGDLRKIGVDLQASAIISSKDKLDFSISYLSSEFTNLLFDFVNPLFPDQDYTGKPETFSPEWTFSFNYSHNFNLADGATVTARIDSRYMTDYLVTFIDKYQDSRLEGEYYKFYSRGEYYTQEAHHLSNFSMIYAPPDGKWTLTGYIKNLENYAEKKNFMMGSMMIGPPRTYGAVLSLRY